MYGKSTGVIQFHYQNSNYKVMFILLHPVYSAKKRWRYRYNFHLSLTLNFKQPPFRMNGVFVYE